MKCRRREIWPLLALLALAGCSQADLVGTYEDELGITRYEFQGEGRVHVSVLGTTVVADYLLENDKVLVTGPQGTLVLTRRNDDLLGPMGLILTRRDP
jgi:hypothetical protein